MPEDIDFYKTIIAGYPSGDKRLSFVQMEALTGWAAKDEWDFKFLGMTNNPFIKANYPHHGAYWQKSFFYVVVVRTQNNHMAIISQFGMILRHDSNDIWMHCDSHIHLLFY